ncbi:MAG: sigma-54-dependent Fis family transcriptional regulator [Phycisphaerae bacterium]
MSDTAFVLIVEDEPQQADALADGLRDAGHACRVATSLDDAMDSIRARRPDVIVADALLAGASNGFKLALDAGRLAPDAEIIVLADDGVSTTAIQKSSSQTRIFELLRKPVSMDDVRAVVARAAEQARGNRDSRVLKEQAERRFEFEGIVTANDQMIRVLNRVQKVADSKLTVLILGESGTGKDLVARAVHRHSPRRGKPYRPINCAGLHENLLESLLFGHVKGAFTGAIADHKGLFEVVDGGTLFLDEVADMPMPMQAKLLRTLENGEIMPVGGNEIRHVDVRVVSATRRDIRTMVENGEFRDDLFYRLNPVTVRLPPLRERREDIPLLIEQFLKAASEAQGNRIQGITPDAVRRLTSYQWMGNARELRSVVEAMVVEADGPTITLDDLPEHIRGSTDIVPAGLPNTAGLTMEQLESLHIANTLKLTGGNREKTAKMLGIGARTLYRKLREYGLQ